MDFDIIKWDGQPISRPGIYSGVPNRVYHGPNLCVAPSASSSGLRTLFIESPLNYWTHSPYNPQRVEKPPTAALILGQATHHLLLGEPGFKEVFAVRPDEYEDAKTGELKKWNGNAKVCQQWLADAELKGLTVLTANDIEVIRGMAGLLPRQAGLVDCGLANCALVQQGILNGLIEHTIVWQDAETGIWLKVRPDGVPEADPTVVDLKTTMDVNIQALESTVSSLRYDMQGALTRMGFREVLGLDIAFALVFVEKDPSHNVKVHTLDPADLDAAEDDLRVCFRAFSHGIKTGKWPGKAGNSNDGAVLRLTPWARERANRQRELLQSSIEGLAA